MIVWILFITSAAGYGFQIAQIETVSQVECERVRAEVVKLPHISKSEAACIRVQRPER